VIGSVRTLNGAPALSQLQPGDTIREVNGVAVRTWNDVRKEIDGSSEAVVIRTQRGDVRIPVSESGPTAEKVADALVFHIPPVIDSVFSGERAAQAALNPETASSRSRDNRSVRGPTWSTMYPRRPTSR
jgi:membrane-associated protease RseP (regulator of RpoE activity)